VAAAANLASKTATNGSRDSRPDLPMRAGRPRRSAVLANRPLPWANLEPKIEAPAPSSRSPAQTSRTATATRMAAGLTRAPELDSLDHLGKPPNRDEPRELEQGGERE
jgi:hypothetical protein